ncbi:hypothetical protein, partial [Roseburia sp. AF25-15LB]|uniref:hypothetical protein n=2 Tax=Roseburia TaxID=841 RepID=UPI001A9B9419
AGSFKNSILINCTTTYQKISSTLWKMNIKCIKVEKANNYKELCIRHTFVKRELLYSRKTASLTPGAHIFQV